jgi:hypothetical protein
MFWPQSCGYADAPHFRWCGRGRVAAQDYKLCVSALRDWIFGGSDRTLREEGNRMPIPHGESHRVLLKALAGEENSYRRWIRPADIIQQSMDERRVRKPTKLAALLQRLRRRPAQF